MGVIVQVSDFNSGEFYIARSTHANTDLSVYIDRVETDYIYRLLGKTLGDLFFDDLSSYIPQTARFTTIFQELNENVGSYRVHSKGIKKILMARIWFEYMCEQSVKNTVVGNVTAKADISEVASFDVVYNKYNASYLWWKSVQYYVLNNAATYPEYVNSEADDFNLEHWSL
jgi:hypothetical protein